MTALHEIQDTVGAARRARRPARWSGSGAAGAAAPASSSRPARCSRAPTTCAARRSPSPLPTGASRPARVAGRDDRPRPRGRRRRHRRRRAGRVGARRRRRAIGTPVVALANPGGRGLRATLGFVASAGRSFRGPRGRRIGGAIEHTAPLPRGSVGGPLVDLDGRLLGINAMRLDGGLILAVPATARGPRPRRALARRRGAAAAAAGRGDRPAARRAAPARARSACRSATACWCARSRTAARPTRPGSSAAT